VKPALHDTPVVAAAGMHLTRTGVALGTAAYMSPEQVRGEKVDARTDLFSFGLVLYEMATGQQAFKGETTLGVRDAILDRAPAPVRELNPEVPVKLEAIINRAVEKDREARYQHAADIRADLMRLQREAESARAVGARRWRGPLGVVLACAAVVAVVALALLLRAPPPPRIVRTTKLTSDRLEKGFRFASDGIRFYFTELVRGRWSLAVIPINPNSQIRVHCSVVIR
jgi:eukaryotic-like serine/threonine-protein kinase